MSSRYDWGNLSKLQLGRYAEYFVKMEFTRLGFDVYTAEVDDKGIDFVIRSADNRYFDVQVKSARGAGLITLPRAKFEPRKNLLAAIVLVRGRPRARVVSYSIAGLERAALERSSILRQAPRRPTESFLRVSASTRRARPRRVAKALWIRRGGGECALESCAELRGVRRRKADCGCGAKGGALAFADRAARGGHCGRRGRAGCRAGRRRSRSSASGGCAARAAAVYSR